MNYSRSLSLFVTLLLGTQVFAGPDADNPHLDPTKVLSSEKCVKCHQSEVEVWQKTPHFKTFRELHRTPEAKQIAKRMGITSIKRNDTCVKCHYTQQQHGAKVKVVSGVSCESCHGASKDWVDIHGDYGGENITRQMETAAHKAQRRAESIKRGMCNPSNLYLVAKNCYSCHTAPNEKLVNVGKHPVGSLDFNLVAWSQGMVRHNFVRSHGKQNAASDQDRLRVMFVVGLLTELEFSLRATAIATEKATYGITNAKRANTVKKKLITLQKKLNNAYVQEVVEIVGRVKLKLNNRDELLNAADAVSKAAYAFAEKTNGAELAVVDPYLPDVTKYK